MTCKKYLENIALYVSGDLDSQDMHAIEHHLAQCASCRTFYEELKADRKALLELQSGHIPFDHTRVLNNIRQQSGETPGDTRSFYRIRPLYAFSVLSLLILLMTGIWMVRIYPGIQQDRGDLQLSFRDLQEQTPELLEEKSRETMEERVEPSRPSLIAKNRNVSSQSRSRRKKPRQQETQRSSVDEQLKQMARFVIRGRVTDPEGQPLPGVVVQIRKGRKIYSSVITDTNGEFEIKARNRFAYLVAKLEGFKTFTREIRSLKSDKPITIQLPFTEDVFITVYAAVADTDARMESEQESKQKGSGPALAKNFMQRAQPPSAKYAPQHAPVFMKKALPAPPMAERKHSLDHSRKEFTGTPEKRTTYVILIDNGSASVRKKKASQPVLVGMKDDGTVLGGFPLREVHVKSRVSGFVAETKVTMRFVNPFNVNEPIEAVYTFPLPTDAAIYDFIMETKTRRVIGLIRPREEAERIYRQARAMGYTASLLTQERTNVFTQKVANIPPGEEVKIDMTYFERLNVEDGIFSYVFPAVVGPRYMPASSPEVFQKHNDEQSPQSPQLLPSERKNISPPVTPHGEEPRVRTTFEIRLHAGAEIDGIVSATHDVQIKRHSKSDWTITLKRPETVFNHDFVLRWKVRSRKLTFSPLFYRGEHGGFFEFMIIPPADMADAEVPPREITFILDVSGSMSGFPLSLSKQFVLEALRYVRPIDSLNVVYFANGSGQLWNRPQPGTFQNVEQVRSFVMSLRGGGGTEMLKGIFQALTIEHEPGVMPIYIILTDGFVGNEYEILDAVERNSGQARFFSVGIGASINRMLIEGIAQKGRGRAFVVLPREQSRISQLARKLVRMITLPVLSQVEIRVKNDLAESLYPRVLDTLYLNQPVFVVGRYTRPGWSSVVLTGYAGDRKRTFEFRVRFPERAPNHRGIRFLWARARIDELLDRYRKAPSYEANRLKKTIVELALKFHIVTPFTAFVAVDSSRVTGSGSPITVVQPVPLPEGVSYKGIFGDCKPRGTPFSIPEWGVVVQDTDQGRVFVVQVHSGTPAHTSGIQPGDEIEAINGRKIRSVEELEMLLLQLPPGQVNVVFRKAGSVRFPL